MHTPGTQVAFIYEKGQKAGERRVLRSHEFATQRQATKWAMPYIMDGHGFDIGPAEYWNEKYPDAQPARA